ncbi:hypothetical protein SDC9_139113 [bioreactor metagenome]|uniref:Uncharacterized protein n=1 Tax=bioreactor metagenome TaxID=1076179 RepID=A0A645DRT8_9ZZZZ
MLVNYPVVQIHHSISNQSSRGSLFLKVRCSVCVFWNFASVSVYRDLTFILISKVRIAQILNIISDCQHKLVCYKSFIHQIKHHLVGHFFYNQLCLFIIIRAMQHLTGRYTVCFRLICFDLLHCARLISPSVVYEQFRIDTEQLVQQFLVIRFIWLSDRTSCNIAHCIKSVFL